jgi:hypothetical protein
MTYIVTRERIEDDTVYAISIDTLQDARSYALETGTVMRNGKVWEYKDGQLVEVPPPKPKRYYALHKDGGCSSRGIADWVRGPEYHVVEYDPETDTARILSKEEVEAL